MVTSGTMVKISHNTIEANPCDVLLHNHQVGAEIPTGVVNNELHCVRVRFGNGMDWWIIHSWQ